MMLILMLACSGGEQPTPPAPGDTHTSSEIYDECPDYEGPPLASDIKTGCLDDDPTIFSIYAETVEASRTTVTFVMSDGFVEEHELPLYPSDCDPQKWQVLLSAEVARGDYAANVSTTIPCDREAHRTVAKIHRVYDAAGNVADCDCTGEELCPSVIDGSLPLLSPISDPESIANCRND